MRRTTLPRTGLERTLAALLAFPLAAPAAFGEV
jgi:hypothetical protein